MYQPYLCHHGVKGMKWGVRKRRTSSGGSSRSSKSSTTKVTVTKKKTGKVTPTKLDEIKSPKKKLTGYEKELFDDYVQQIKNRHTYLSERTEPYIYNDPLKKYGVTVEEVLSPSQRKANIDHYLNNKQNLAKEESYAAEYGPDAWYDNRGDRMLSNGYKDIELPKNQYKDLERRGKLH